MAPAGSARLIGELTFQEIPTKLGKTSILCLPIGSFEQHGPHLPLNTDVVLAEGVTRLIVARWGEALDLWQLPAVSISLAREHEWAPGTMSLSIEGMTRCMRDLGREIARSLPARNLLIVNGHGGNRGILEALAQDLRADFGLNICIINPAAMADTNADSAVPEVHGGKNETSMMLAIAPHLVRRELIVALKNPPDGDAIRTTIRHKGVTWPWTSDDRRLADTGVIGDPKAASAEFGQAIVDHVVEAAGAILQQLLDNQRR
jgi:creatinine amidohydrolase/Fe(II)-dependent formamide hydrolase-like protein